MLRHGRFVMHHARAADETSLSCPVIRSKTEPIEKCSHRPVVARTADASVTQSGSLWAQTARLPASACEHSTIGYALLRIDSREGVLMHRPVWFSFRCPGHGRL
jgi:hypothetical protein